MARPSDAAIAAILAAVEGGKAPNGYQSLATSGLFACNVEGHDVKTLSGLMYHLSGRKPKADGCNAKIVLGTLLKDGYVLPSDVAAITADRSRAEGVAATADYDAIWARVEKMLAKA